MEAAVREPACILATPGAVDNGRPLVILEFMKKAMLGVRLDEAVIARIDAQIERIFSLTSVRVDRSDIARSIVAHGLAVLEGDKVPVPPEAPPRRKRAAKEAGR